ncbi:hypothetical protein HY732_04665 [Candidatus Uhrbacteria bacterium]|nr:hypothetical protein [Candidatus Uhrbacteria bacterium]
MRFFLLIVWLLMMGGTPLAYAASMTSSNWVILSDTQNCGGGKSTSTNYILFDSLCENAAGAQTGTSYVLDSGFQGQKDRPFIDATLSGNALAFGTLSPSSISSSTVTLTVTTNANGGYNADIVTDGALRTSGGSSFTDASASDTISAGSGKYGIRTSGDDGQYNATDTGISASAKTVASKTSGASASVTTITFKAAPSGLTSAGQYSQAITILVAGTF